MLELNKLYNMHNLEGMKQIPDKFFDIAIPDPPYGINAPNMQMGQNLNRKDNGWHQSPSTAVKLRKGRLNNGGGKLKGRILNNFNCDWDMQKPPKEFWRELFRVSKHQIIWGYNYFPLPPSRGVICWDKLQPWDNFSQFELAWTSFDKPAWKISLSNRGGANLEQKIHPTQKPIALYRKILQRYGQKGMKILDTHSGSSSLVIACIMEGFEYMAFELDKQYYESSNTRIQNHLLQTKLF